MTKKTWKNIRTMLPSVLLALTAGWFTACSSDDEADAGETLPQQRAIAFGGAMGEAEKVQNRATTSPLEDYVQQFHLWGYKTMSHNDADGYQNMQTVFDGYTVEHTANSAGTSSDNTAGWHYVGGTSLNSEAQTIKYWDFSATSYRFMAVATDATTGYAYQTQTINGELHGAVTYSDLSPDAGVWFSKLWFSNNGSEPDMPEYKETVQLRFFTPYCKVRFMLTDEDGLALSSSSAVYPHITSRQISFAPVNLGVEGDRRVSNEGSFTMYYPIAGKSIEEFFHIVPDNDVIMNMPYETPGNYVFADEANKEHRYTLFPNDVKRNFQLTLEYDGLERTAVVPEEFMVWEANHEYTYVFKITEKEFAFMPTLYVNKEWQSGYTPDTPVDWSSPTP